MYKKCLWGLFNYKKNNQEEWGRATGFAHKPILVMQKLTGDILIVTFNAAAEQ